MKDWQALVIVFVCAAVFLPSALLRIYPYGFDSYYYLNVVCGNTGFVANEPFLSQAVFSILPCDRELLLTIVFFLMALCCLATGLLGERLVKDKGWLAGVFVLASLVFDLSYFGIENELFAYPLLFFAAFLFYGGFGWKARGLAFVLALVSTQFWLGGWLMVAVFLLSHIALLPFLVLIGFFRGKAVLGQLLPNLAVQESFPGFGLWYQGLLLVALLYLKEMKAMFIPIMFFSLIAFVNMKFSVFVSFFLAILAANMLGLQKLGWMRHLPYVGVALCALFLWETASTLPPNQFELEAVVLAVQDANGSVVCNQWGYGHLIEFFGGNPSDKAGGEQQCKSCKDCIVLGFDWQPGCRLLKWDKKLVNSLKVFSC